MSHQQIVQTASIVWRVTPYGFYKYGRDFSDAARSVSNENGTVVPYFLECQAIELGLKSFLLLKGSEKQLLKRKFGHNIGELLRRAKTEGLAAFVTLTSDEETAIFVATRYYDGGPRGKRFQYFDLSMIGGERRWLPKLSDLSSAAHKIVRNEALERACLAGELEKANE